MRKSVPTLLRSMSSTELTEWQAFERFNGPLDQQYDRETNARTNELLQLLIRAMTNGGDGEKFPFTPVQRPWWTPPEEEESEEAYLERIQREQKAFRNQM